MQVLQKKDVEVDASIEGLCGDQKTLNDVISMSPRARFELFSQSKKITAPAKKLAFRNSKAGEQKCLF